MLILELDSKTFNGGNETNNFLRSRNFIVLKKPKISQVDRDIESEGFDSIKSHPEGAQKRYYSKKYERNPKNRLKAIIEHGLICKVCGFNFEEIYGEKGRGYIEVHHIIPLSYYKEEILINPKTDLIPVCANCHRILHRKQDELLTIEELRKLVKCNKTSSK